MSERPMRPAVVLATCLACVLCASAAAAQTRREELAARIDSLAAAYDALRERVRASDSLRRDLDRTVRVDTARVGPFLVLDTADVEAMTAALRRTWAAYEPIAGRGSARIANTVVTRTLPSIAERVHVIRLYRVGSAGHARAAERVVAEALTAALPADLRHWLDGGTVRPQATFESTYRELATSHSRDARNCRAGVTAACVGALGLTDADPASREAPEPPLGAAARAALLTHVLRAGGSGAYERLFDDAPDVAARLSNAAGMPLDELIADWRRSVAAAQPNVLAGVAHAGLWTVLWLAGLALFAMRSTRWRVE